MCNQESGTWVNQVGLKGESWLNMLEDQRDKEVIKAVGRQTVVDRRLVSGNIGSADQIDEGAWGDGSWSWDEERYWDDISGKGT